MKKKIKIAVFFPNSNQYYLDILLEFKKYFENLNYEFFGFTSLINENSLNKIVKENKIDVIFEMNRTRFQIPRLNKKVIHIAWMVDCGNYSYKEIDKSEILYFWGRNWFDNYKKNFLKNKDIKILDWLPPAGTSSFLKRKKTINKKKIIDISFYGHIPRPWCKNELNRFVDKQKTLNFRKFIKYFNEKIKKFDVSSFDNFSYFQIAKKILQKKNIDILENDKKLFYDISCRNFRYGRIDMINLILKCNKNLNIYGTKNWIDYKNFELYYKGYLESKDAIFEMINNSKIILHEGVGLHDRFFDTILMNGFIMYYKTDYDQKNGLITNFFEEEKELITFNKFDAIPKIEKYLKDDNARNKIQKTAYKKIKNNHLWKHRISIINKHILKII